MSVEDLQAQVAALTATVEKLSARVDELEENKSAAAPKPKAKSRPGTAKKRRPGTGKKKTSKVTAVRVPKSESKDDATEEIDPARKGSYNVFKTKIHYVVPDEFADHKVDESRKPKGDLKLEWVYGFNGRTSRSNVYFADDDKFVYCIAGAGVVADFGNRTQTHFTGHNEDITALAVHPTEPIVATGQLDPKGAGTPFICIWNHDGELIRKITAHERSIPTLAFSPDGKWLASTGGDDDHTLMLHKVNGKGDKADFECPSGKSVVRTIAFAPTNEEVSDYHIVMVGTKLFKYWTFSGDAVPKGKAVSTMSDTKISQKAFHDVAFAPQGNGTYMVGTDSGAVYLCNGQGGLAKSAKNKAIFKTKAHSDAVTAVASFEGGFVSGSGGKKGTVITTWDYESDGKSEKLTSKDSFNVGAYGRPTSIQVRNGKAVIGTRNNYLFTLDLASGKIDQMLAEGHAGEIWALAVHPKEPIVVTGAIDKTLRIYNYENKSYEEGVKELKGKPRAAVFSPDGATLFVSFESGKITAYEFASRETKWSKSVAKEQIDAMAVSPDGSTLVAGSWDQLVYSINPETGKTKASMKGHGSSILMVQFTEDGKYVMTNSKDLETLYWDMTKGKRVKKAAFLTEAKWANWNCFLGYTVQGIWEGADDATDVNTVHRSPDQSTLAVGTDFGEVRIYPYPATAKNQSHKAYSGHSSFVTNIRWSGDGKTLFSAGGLDFSTFQWRLE